MADQPFSNQEIPPQLKELGKNFKYIVLALVVLVAGFSSTFQVGPEEVGLVVQLGRYDRTVNSGLSFKLPFLEEVYKVPVERQLKQEFGFRTVQAGVNTRYSQREYDSESVMLTGDLNLGDVEWVVQYRISDPYNYLFKIRNPEETLRDISESSMRRVVGDRTVNEVLTVGRAEVAAEAERMIQKICSQYQMGIQIEQIVLQDINPPEKVKPSFNQVNEAQQERETLINEAKAAYNKVIPRARGQAQETIQKAEGYALERVNTAKGEVSRFNDIYREYLKAPAVTKKRIYLETMEDIIPKMGSKIIVDEKGSNVLPLLQLKGQN